MDKNQFWDNLLEIILQGMKIMIKVDSSIPLRLYLSGGKDSRVIFALCDKINILDRLNVASTGPIWSHDVVVSSIIADKFGIHHTISDNVYTDIDYSEDIAAHIFITEGRTTPFDLKRFIEHYDKVSLTGHELGLRESFYDIEFEKYNEKAIFSWLKRNYNNFDVLNSLSDDTTQLNDNFLKEWIASSLQATKEKTNIPFRFEVETKILHSTSALKLADTITECFAPYFIMTDHVLKATYNAGIKARASELFHYEILKRLNPWLVYECPFGDQEWPPLLKEEMGDRFKKLPDMIPSMATKVAIQKGSYGVFSSKKDEIFSYLLESTSCRLFNYVDYNKLYLLKDHPIDMRQSQIIWNLFMLKYIFSLNSYTDCSPFSSWKNKPTIPELKFVTKREITDAQLADRMFCNTLMERSDRLDYYSKAIIDILSGRPKNRYSNRYMNLGYRSLNLGDKESALYYFQKAAKNNHPDAYFMIGKMYIESKGPKENMTLGMDYLNQSVEKGSGPAMEYLGNLYYEGKTVKQDYYQALHLYKKAIESNHFWPLFRLATMVESGKGTDPSPETAGAYWKLARTFFHTQALKGNTWAKYVIGKLMVDGLGGNQDKEQGIKWLSIAAHEGLKIAEDILRRR